MVSHDFWLGSFQVAVGIVIFFVVLYLVAFLAAVVVFLIVGLIEMVRRDIEEVNRAKRGRQDGRP